MLPQKLPYNKPFRDPAAQVVLLKSRGLEIINDSDAEEYLRRIGYYRLSAYWYPFRTPVAVNPPHRSDVFLPDSRFDDAVSLYIFDKKLKVLIWEAIEQIEISLRVEIAIRLGAKNPIAYTNLSNLDPNFGMGNGPDMVGVGVVEHAKWIVKMDSMSGRSKEEFIKHYKRTYCLPIPIWIAIELWDFGMMSHLYKGLKTPDKQFIAQKFGVVNCNLLESWLRALNFVRNIIAHHARLWNRVLVDYPTLPSSGLMVPFDLLSGNPGIEKRVYTVLCILSHLLRTVDPTSNWKFDVVSLSTAFPAMPHAKLSDAGFPANWQNHPFWK